jgi:hypothetical protein
VTRSDALACLRDAAAMWSAGFEGPASVVLAACDALVSGEDGRTLAMLAGLPLRALDDRDVEDLLEQALAEVGLPFAMPNSREAEESGLVVMARRTLSGAVSPCDLASWAHRTFGHDRLAMATRLAELDDVYDTIEYTDMTPADVDAEVLDEARHIAMSATPG